MVGGCAAIGTLALQSKEILMLKRGVVDKKGTLSEGRSHWLVGDHY